MDIMKNFGYMKFCGDITQLAVSQKVYSREKAINIAKRELRDIKAKYLAIGNGYVRHRVGIDDEGTYVGWWLENKEYTESRPCWVFHMTDDKDEWCSRDYEYIDWKGER